MIGPGFDVFRAEAPAVHIQAHPDPVAQDGHENHQQRGDDGKRSADVRHQTDGGDHLEQRQPDGDRHQQRVRDDPVGIDEDGERLGIKELCRAGMEKNDGKRPAHESVDPRRRENAHPAHALGKVMGQPARRRHPHLPPDVPIVDWTEVRNQIV